LLVANHLAQAMRRLRNGGGYVSHLGSQSRAFVSLFVCSLCQLILTPPPVP
jgi:hypothetical protein